MLRKPTRGGMVTFLRFQWTAAIAAQVCRFAMIHIEFGQAEHRGRLARRHPHGRGLCSQFEIGYLRVERALEGRPGGANKGQDRQMAGGSEPSRGAVLTGANKYTLTFPNDAHAAGQLFLVDLLCCNPSAPDAGARTQHRHSHERLLLAQSSRHIRPS